MGFFSILSPSIEPGATKHMRCDLEIRGGGDRASYPETLMRSTDGDLFF